MKRLLPILGLALALIYCTSHTPSTPTAPPATATSSDGRVAANDFPTSAPVPVPWGPVSTSWPPTPTPKPTPVPTGGGGGPTPTPTPTPNTEVQISGAGAGDFEAFRVPADGLYARHKDETWRDDLFAGDVIIRTTNANRTSIADPQATLTITSNVDVNAFIYVDGGPIISDTGWATLQGFLFTGSADSYETPTDANPTSSNVFSIRRKEVGRSGTVQLGPNSTTEAPAGCDALRNCQPMYWIVVRSTELGAFNHARPVSIP